jgi:hypothetical protein
MWLSISLKGGKKPITCHYQGRRLHQAWFPWLCRTHCCVYALNMAYVAESSAPSAAIAVTNQASVPVAISCNGTSQVVLTKSDLAVRTPPAANGTISGVFELTSQVPGVTGLFLATVEVAPDYTVSSACRRLPLLLSHSK